MNIGIFTDTYYPDINGVANSTVQLKQELEKRGHNVYIFTVRNPRVTEPEANVFRMNSIPVVVLKELRFGCSSLLFWYQRICQLHLDVIHTQTEFTVGQIGREAARKLGIPLIHTYHTIYEDYTHYFKVPGNQALRGPIRYVSSVCCNQADVVIAPTEKVRDLLMSYKVKKHIVVQPTGIDSSKFRNVDEDAVTKLRKQYGIQESDHVLISIGRLSQEKSLDEVILYTAKIRKEDPALKLLIVGSGPAENDLRELVSDTHSDEFVIFTGAVPWKEIQNYYALGDVFVSASTSETQGLTYVEALASGKPLLAREDDCLKGLLRTGENGYSFTSGESFITGYRNLFTDDAWKQMMASAAEAAERVSSAAFGAGIENIYREAIRSGRMQAC